MLVLPQLFLPCSHYHQALYDPAEAALKGDGDFGKVLGQGAIGLGQGLAGGTVGLVSNVTKRTGSILATLTFDKEFQANRDSELKKTTGIADGVTTGAKQFGKGLAGGRSRCTSVCRLGAYLHSSFEPVYPLAAPNLRSVPSPCLRDTTRMVCAPGRCVF